MAKTGVFEDLQIESGVPLPERRGQNVGLRLKMQAMKPMQSVYIPYALCKRGSIMTCAKDIFGRGKYRAQGDSKGVRIWRIK